MHYIYNIYKIYYIYHALYFIYIYIYIYIMLLRIFIMLKQNEVGKKIPNIPNLATTAVLNAEINEVKNKIPIITNLTNTTALVGNENKRPTFKETNNNTIISEIENKITTDLNKYITTQEFNKLTAEKFSNSRRLAQGNINSRRLAQGNINSRRLAQGNLARKNDFDSFVKKIDFDDNLKKINKNVTSNRTKYIVAENELSEKVTGILTKRSRTFLIDKFSIPNGAKYFSSGIFQYYLVFIPIKKYIVYSIGTTRINL